MSSLKFTGVRSLWPPGYDCCVCSTALGVQSTGTVLKAQTAQVRIWKAHTLEMRRQVVTVIGARSWLSFGWARLCCAHLDIAVGIGIRAAKPHLEAHELLEIGQGGRLELRGICKQTASISCMSGGLGRTEARKRRRWNRVRSCTSRAAAARRRCRAS